MLWDGDCGFCARWIKKWEKQTGDKIRYIPYQFFEVDPGGRLKDFPAISAEDCKKSVQLITPAGEHLSAAEAVLYSLYYAGQKKYLFWLYKNIPGFKPLTELIYKLIAANRGKISY